MGLSSRGVAGLLAGLVLVILLLPALAPAPEQLSAYRSGPGELGALKRLASAKHETGSLVGSPLVLDGVPAEDTLLVIAGVEREYRASEIAAIEAFVDRGGSLIVADDFGFGNGLAIRYGVQVARARLLDERFRTNASVVEVNASLRGQHFALLLNEPSAFPTACGGPGVVACSSNHSFLDMDGDAQRTPGVDLGGPLAVAVERGRVLLLSDPGILTDRMLAEADNALFVEAVFALLLPHGGKVIFDESRHPAGLESGFAALFAGLTVPVRDPVLAPLVLGAIAGLVALGWFALRPAEALHIHRPRLDEPRPPAAGPAELLRQAARERIRLAHRIDPTLAKDLTDAGMSLLVTDQEIADLLRLPGEVPEEKIDHYMQKIKSYRGPAG